MSPSIAKLEYFSDIVLPWDVELFVENLTGKATTKYYSSCFILFCYIFIVYLSKIMILLQSIWRNTKIRDSWTCGRFISSINVEINFAFLTIYIYKLLIERYIKLYSMIIFGYHINNDNECYLFMCLLIFQSDQLLRLYWHFYDETAFEPNKFISLKSNIFQSNKDIKIFNEQNVNVRYSNCACILKLMRW